MSPTNNFLTVSPVGNADAPAEFYQTMNMSNALQFYSATINLEKKLIYESKPEKKMTNACDDSYPEGSIEANIWKIINLEVMAGEGCPVEKGSGYTFPQWLRGTELMFDEPLEYGNYTLLVDFDTPQGAWALKLEFEFVVDENSECTESESSDESTESPKNQRKHLKSQKSLKKNQSNVI
ncbi:GSCOCG00002309001-RA-CDS [Cotesia congregata]|nr:GSCOCG00002309001-RA-CDS [Cotesia congregata]